MTQIYPINSLTEVQLQTIAKRLEQGALAAVATDTVYGLCTSALQEPAIKQIYQIKQRPAGCALQILVGSVAQAKSFVQWNQAAEKLARAYWPGPLTLILPPQEQGLPLRRGFEGLGLRVPAHKGLLHLLQKMQVPMACTSANIHGRPVCVKEPEVIEFLEGKVDFILTDGTLSAQASSVVDLTREPTLLRQGVLTRKQLQETLQGELK